MFKSFLWVFLTIFPFLKEGTLGTDSVQWESFLSQHDMYWTSIQADHDYPSSDKPGYYSGALMGNGLIGTNLYKLSENVYRLNLGRSDITEQRDAYSLFGRARLPIGYFTIACKGKVLDERMHLSLYNAITDGCFTTDKGSLSFRTYVHAQDNYVVFETDATGSERDFTFDFVPQQAVSPRYVFRKEGPADYLNSKGESNPSPIRMRRRGIELLTQALVSDTTFTQVRKAYTVAWKEIRKGGTRRILATISFEDTIEDSRDAAIKTIERAARVGSSAAASSHCAWWNRFYKDAAFLSFPDKKYESFYWMQYYKFASTARADTPIVDLQGVWPVWDTPWTAVWLNLNIQLTYSWQVKANLGWLAQPLWNALYSNRANLTRNVTDIPGQEGWTDSAVLPRTSGYEMYSPLRPELAESNQYEVGNLTWTLFYYWQHCVAYADDDQLVNRLFPLLKSAVNVFFHIRREVDGRYHLPATASPEYLKTNVGPDTCYDLANLRWGLQTLIDIDTKYALGDPMRAQWIDFLERLTDFPYSEDTGFKVSATEEFLQTGHRHYSHLFMIYPYHMLSWDDPRSREMMDLSISRWKGNQGYSRTGKAAMLASKGEGDAALAQMDVFMSKFLKPNTLYAETGPVIETPLAAVSTLHEFYMQDWGDTIRIFNGCPSAWKDASFINMRAKGAFLVSAVRKNSKTEYVQVLCEKGGPLTIDCGWGPLHYETAPGQLIQIQP